MALEVASSNTADNSLTIDAPSLTVHHQLSNVVQPHPQTEEIIQQVEYYFSDENLPYDAHLLARTGGDGNGPTSIKEILGFRKMRRFRPPAQVKAALRLSKVLEVVNNKQIKRRYPLTVPLMVKPKLADGRGDNSNIKNILVEKPWLTKAMLRPTGFEEYATEGPIKPQEYEDDRKVYDPEESFVCRIEIAVSRYMAKRKMHSFTRNIFTQLVRFGGFAVDMRQFGGGFAEGDLENYDNDQKAQIKSGFEVANMVVDGLYEDAGKGSTTWSVDFVDTAKAFLSSRILALIDWGVAEEVKNAVNVPRNFYNFLLLHDVCPEYHEQILEARRYCDIADEELPRLGSLDHKLPGDFNTACSTLHQSDKPYNVRPETGSVTQWTPDVNSTAEQDALRIFTAGVKAFGTADQVRINSEHVERGTLAKVIREEAMGLEVMDVEYLENPHGDHITGGNAYVILDRMGKLICKRWKVPHARPKDLPSSVVKANKESMSETLWFIVNEEALKLCTVGIKIEAFVKTLDNGLSWIDAVLAVYPTYFTWIANESQDTR